MLKYIFFGVTCALTTALTHSACADTSLDHRSTCSSSFYTQAPSQMEFDLYAGKINGKSFEIVYDGADSKRVLSELQWEIKNLWVVGGIFQTTLGYNRLHFKIDGWTKMHMAPSTMIDKDFFDSDSSEFTHISKHPKTKLDMAQMLGGEIGYDFFCFDRGLLSAQLRCSVGYEFSHFHWKASGGSYVYREEGYTYIGNFADHLIIDYKQRFSVPYLALQLNLNWQGATLSFFGKYSDIARVKTNDKHLARDVLFIDSFNDAEYCALGANISGNIWTLCGYPLKVNLKYSYQWLDTTRGDTKISSPEDSSVKLRDIAGISQFYHIITVGLSTKF
jgi:plasminogen activator